MVKYLFKKYHLVFFCNIIGVTFPSDQDSTFFLSEVRSLSELPMNNLLKLKSNLAEENDIQWESDEFESKTLPMTLPLKRTDRKSIRRHGDHWDEKGGDTKISKIFQLAITTLSFLAFGGYLMTLVITAIRRNSMTQGSNVIVLSSLQKYTRPKRRAVIINPMENEFDTDRLYRGMILLSQEYANYNKHR